MNSNSYCKDVTLKDAIMTPFKLTDGFHFKTVPLGIISVYNFISVIVLILMLLLFLITLNLTPATAVFFILITTVLHSAYVQAYLIQGIKCKEALYSIGQLNNVGKLY